MLLFLKNGKGRDGEEGNSFKFLVLQNYLKFQGLPSLSPTKIRIVWVDLKTILIPCCYLLDRLKVNCCTRLDEFS